ncbi:MAG: hypothetical protein J0L93_08450 [Deltaproteobacteria bacterium]|nr:hypothetical protein [Deltaproteobacteria bacterium]
MKKLNVVGLLLIATIFFGCAGTKADLEEARYLLGKGDKENAAKAISILEPMLTSSSGAQRLETYRLYAGAQIQAAGVDSIKIISTVVYKVSENTVTLTRDAFSTLTSDSGVKFRSAISNLDTLIGEDVFAAASLRDRQGIYYQRGLAYLFDALRIAVQISEINLDTFTTVTCEDAYTNAAADDKDTKITTNLGSAAADFDSAGLDPSNALYSLSNSLKSSVDTAGSTAAICAYLLQQKNLSE